MAGRHVIAACKRYKLDIKNAKKKGWFLDEETVCKQIDFMESLKHTKSQWHGMPFKLSPPQKFFIWNCLGFRMLKTKHANGNEFHPRRFRQGYLTMARKGGKSTFACALLACLSYFDFPIEVEAENYCVGTKEDQAKRMVTQTAKMIELEPELLGAADLFRYKESINPIVLPKPPYNGSFIKALGSDGKRQDALNIHLEIRDEIHEWRKQHEVLWGKMETGSGSRPQPFCLLTTTSGDDDSEIWMRYDAYCVSVVESAMSGDCIDDTVFAFIARLDEARPCACAGMDSNCDRCVNGEIPADDPFDETNWEKANPGIGVTPEWDEVRAQARKAKNEKAYLSDFLRYKCNIKVRSVTKVIHPDLWAKRSIRMNPWTGNCFGAWDIGTRDDLAGIALVKQMEDGSFQGRAIGLCPEDGPRDLTKSPWCDWIDQGHLIATPGDTLQLSEMENLIRDKSDEYGVTEWAYDERHSLQMAQNLEVDGIECYSFKQSYMMYNEPFRDFLQALAEGRFSHDGNSFLAYCAGNLARKERDKLWMPDKDKSEDKIDPMVAMIMAYARASFAPKPVQSVYNRRGSLAV